MKKSAKPVPKHQIETRSCSDLRPDPDNPRKTITGQKRAALRASLSRFGMVDPILVSGTLIVGGHQRLDVWWRDLNNQTTPVIDVGELAEPERHALNIALNNIESEWDYDRLSKILRGMRESNVALLDVSGFGARELSRLIGKPEDTRRMLEDFATEPNPGRSWLVIQGTPGAVAAAKSAITKVGADVRVESYTEDVK